MADIKEYAQQAGIFSTYACMMAEEFDIYTNSTDEYTKSCALERLRSITERVKTARENYHIIT